MERAIFEVHGKGIQEIKSDEFHPQKLKASSIYLCDIKVPRREDVIDELLSFGIDARILEHILEPSEHIRFQFFGNSAYGELAHFSPESEEHLQYIGVIVTDQVLFFIYDEGEDILSDLVDSFPESSEMDSKLQSVSIFYLLFIKSYMRH